MFFCVLLLIISTTVFSKDFSSFFSPPGMVSFTYRKSFSKSFSETLDSLQRMGITDMEFSNLFGKKANEIRSELEKRGMVCSSFGVSYDDLLNKTDEVANNAQKLGAKYVRVAWVHARKGDVFTLKDAQDIVKIFNRIGKILKEKYDLSFCYHNHGYEFYPYGKGTLFDYIIENTDQRYVNFEMDILWIFFGGGDPVEYLRRYVGRFPLMHLKDLRKGVAGNLSGATAIENDVALGEGQLDIESILEVAKLVGVKHFYIEDESPIYYLQVPKSIAYLRTLESSFNSSQTFVDSRSTNKREWIHYPIEQIKDLPHYRGKIMPVNKYGSSIEKRYKASGFFRTELIDGRWTLIDPEGYLFFHKGIACVAAGTSNKQKNALVKKYGTIDEWVSQTNGMLKEYGFNGAGAWSDIGALRQLDSPLVYTAIAWPMGRFKEWHKKLVGGYNSESMGWQGYQFDLVRVFDPEFIRFLDADCRRFAEYKNDKYLLGYFIDNELPWVNDALDRHIKYLGSSDPCKKAAQSWLNLRKGKIATLSDITQDDRDAFWEYYAGTYFRMVREYVKKYDPNHLFLGVRFNQRKEELSNPFIFKEAGKYFDVISINHYHEWEPIMSRMENWEKWSGKPFIITEYYVKAEDSGFSNNAGAGWLVKTQNDRGLFYQNFALKLLRSKGCVGWNWFRYQDNDPDDLSTDPSNRDSNKGLVTGEYANYQSLLDICKNTNDQLYSLLNYFKTLNVDSSSISMTEQAPMKEIVENSARYRWENKNVIESRLIDDMDVEKLWFHPDLGTIDFVKNRVKSGNSSLRIRSATKGVSATKDSRAWGMASAVKAVNVEDWSLWNRISLWVYPDLPGHKTISFYLDIYNDSDSLGNGGSRNRDNIILKNGQWNHVVSEIEHFNRNKITAIALRCRLHGHEEKSADEMIYYFDKLELQKVIPDSYRGWNMAPGKIGFCHVGYRPEAMKVALASNLPVNRFSIIDADRKAIVLDSPIRYLKSDLGEYHVLDFSSVVASGNYYIKAGEFTTPVFKIGDDVWQSPLEKVINFFYVERCGCKVPTVHNQCHLDWKGSGLGEPISINGGWHDAGDLSQSLYNTAEITKNLFLLYEKMSRRDELSAFSKQVLSEATWGLNWLLKTIDKNNFRSVWAVNAWWSNNIIGDFDDVKSQLAIGSFERYTTVSAEITAARILKTIDKEKSEQALEMAKRDWKFGLCTLNQQKEKEDFCLSISAAIIAGIELYQETKEWTYAAKALELSQQLIRAQERSYIDKSKAITGFLYTNDTDRNILHTVTPGSYELLQLTALAKLCEAFPLNEQWMKWYSGVVLYSAYFHEKCSLLFEPYNLLVGGIYHVNDWKKGFANYRNGTVRKSDQELMKTMIQGGKKIASDYVVRAFPPSPTGFGTTHLNLAQAAALALSAHLRGDLNLIHLCERQLEWTFGRNPFTQSFMYGEGYDYLPYYNPMSGNIVGAMPVGIGAIPSDEPYWPAGNNEPSKREQWVHTGARLLNLLTHITGVSTVIGKSSSCVVFENTVTQKRTVANSVNGFFEKKITAGVYKVTADGITREVAYLPGKNYNFDSTIDYSLRCKKEEDGEVTIELLLTGKGKHVLDIRTENLKMKVLDALAVDLSTGRTEQVILKGEKLRMEEPWFAVVIADNDFSNKKELYN